MCRYAMYGPYKLHAACFRCRKSFKCPMDARAMPKEDVGPLKCPQCAGPMVSLGLDFRPPRQRDVRQWKKVELLWRHGVEYHSCGCGGPGYRPRTLAEVPAFLAGRLPRTPGEALLRSIQARRPR